MAELLACLCILCAQAIYAPEIYGSHELVDYPKSNLPATLAGWTRFLESTYGEDTIVSEAKFVHQQHALGLRVKLTVPGLEIAWWEGVGEKPMMGFPLAYTIASEEALHILGIGSQLVADIAQPHYSVSPGVYFVAVDCWDAGCTEIEVRVEGDTIKSIRWTYPID